MRSLLDHWPKPTTLELPFDSSGMFRSALVSYGGGQLGFSGVYEMNEN